MESAKKDKPTFLLYFKIMINHLHVLVLVSTFDFNWPR